jgi:hypothetical protein
MKDADNSSIKRSKASALCSRRLRELASQRAGHDIAHQSQAVADDRGPLVLTIQGGEGQLAEHRSLDNQRANRKRCDRELPEGLSVTGSVERQFVRAGDEDGHPVAHGPFGHPSLDTADRRSLIKIDHCD